MQYLICNQHQADNILELPHNKSNPRLVFDDLKEASEVCSKIRFSVSPYDQGLIETPSIVDTDGNIIALYSTGSSDY